ncbi:MAG TPA: nucleotidyltransferase [Actinomycetota bacterium]|nr:nucleotidyltransferase [Actinomycetota bacterium]
MSEQSETLVPGTATPFDNAHPPDEDFLAVLSQALDVLRAEGLDHVVIGGLASAALGRPRWTHDVDIFVRSDEADKALEVLSRAGFETHETNPLWLYKAIKDGVVIDVIFKSKGDLYLDDEMLARAVHGEFKGVKLPLAPPEDIVVIKAAVHDEERPRHWHDALGILIRTDLDWDYLLLRARHATKRVLSLLIYASSNDVVIPAHVIRTLFDQVYGQEGSS